MNGICVMGCVMILFISCCLICRLIFMFLCVWFIVWLVSSSLIFSCGWCVCRVGSSGVSMCWLNVVVLVMCRWFCGVVFGLVMVVCVCCRLCLMWCILVRYSVLCFVNVSVWVVWLNRCMFRWVFSCVMFCFIVVGLILSVCVVVVRLLVLVVWMKLWIDWRMFMMVLIKVGYCKDCFYKELICCGLLVFCCFDYCVGFVIVGCFWLDCFVCCFFCRFCWFVVGSLVVVLCFMCLFFLWFWLWWCWCVWWLLLLMLGWMCIILFVCLVCIGWLCLLCFVVFWWCVCWWCGWWYWLCICCVECIVG